MKNLSSTWKTYFIFAFIILAAFLGPIVMYPREYGFLAIFLGFVLMFLVIIAVIIAIATGTRHRKKR